MSTKSSARIKQKRRAGEPWVSNNRVLTGIVAKKGGTLGRNPNFDTDETKLLIQLWGDPKVQRTLITTHKKHAVICQLATKMQEYGYYRSPEEITTRIKNLKCFYNRLKKDMETESVQQQTAEPTWKHFAEMDAIMTRPIFSVRPNEVPAPSLKYQLEQAKEERQERRRKVLEEGGTLSESDDDSLDGGAFSKAKQEIDDGIIPDVEVDIDITDETFVAITNAAEKSEKSVKKRKISKNSDSSLGEASDYEGESNANANEDLTSDEEKELKIKEENDSNDSSSEAALLLSLANRGEPKAKPETTITTTLSTASIKTTKDNEGALVIPKEEPIDVDAEYEFEKTGIPTNANVKSLMPTLADILQMSKTNLAISSSAMVMPVSSTTTIAGLPANYVTATSTNTMKTSIAATGPQGKISLVPTNFLMQPKTATVVTNTNSGILPVQPSHPIHLLQNSMSPQMQQRLVLSGGPQPSAQATPNKTGIVTTGPGGMKVLLVNADAQSGANTGLAQQISAANCMGMGKTLSMPLNNATALMQQQQQQQQLQQLQQQLQQQQLQQQQNLNQQKQQLQQQKEALQQQQQHHQQEQKIKRQEREKKREELMSKKDATSMRILLRQLLNAQTENNEIQHQRLSMERERLDFEKSMAERFLTALPAFFGQQQQQSAAAAAVASTQMRLNPPKLVFTTATSMPQSVASATSTILNTSSATTLTASLPKATAAKPIEICTQINDIQLLTPKLETEAD